MPPPLLWCEPKKIPVLSRRGQATGANRTVPVFPGGATSRRGKILPTWPHGMPVFKMPARPAEDSRSFSHCKSLALGPAASGQRATGQRRPDLSEEAPGPGDAATTQAAAAPQPATQPGVSWQGTAGGWICLEKSLFHFRAKIVSMIPFFCRGVGRPPARTGRSWSSRGVRQADAARSCQRGRVACPF